MDKIKIGIPRSMHYYYYGELWKHFFQKLNCEIIISPKTNLEIMEKGIKCANDEMCLSMKNLLGHIAYLEGKCDYILIPRVDNYGHQNQTCTNFLAIYDIASNMFQTKILTYNIDVVHHETEEKGLVKIGQQLGFSKKETLACYQYACDIAQKQKQKQIQKNLQKLTSPKEKILVIAHPYNIYDDWIGKPITDYLKKLDVEIIYSDSFYSNIASRNASQLSHTLYWKFNKENIGAIPIVKDKIDGIIFLSTFPCGPDSLVNELVIRKINIPYINLILDDIDGLAGFETRLESFIDILQERRQKHV